MTVGKPLPVGDSVLQVQGRRTALIVTIPEAEPAVAEHRMRLDPSAPLGVGAHVTVLFPFAPAEEIVSAELGELFADHEAFDYRFATTRWFDDRVLWLAPGNSHPFRMLTEAVHANYPGYPPFGGVFDDVIPHLTIGHDQPVAVLRAAEAEVTRELPIEGRATAVTLIGQGVGGYWSAIDAFPLRGT